MYVGNRRRRGARMGSIFLVAVLHRSGGNLPEGMPLWFANGTDATTGNRAITTPIGAPDRRDSESPWPFRGARDFHTLMNEDVFIETAINNTARLPLPGAVPRNAPDRGRETSWLARRWWLFRGRRPADRALDLDEWVAANLPRIGPCSRSSYRRPEMATRTSVALM
jgi:hypothetical protein